jgi:hypothetical protein
MLKKLLRYKNLKERGYVNSRNQLKALIKRCGFPPGRHFSDRIVTWEEDEVISWYESRPFAGGPEPEPLADPDNKSNNNIADKPAAIAPASKGDRTPSRQTAARYGPDP